ncbi:putative ABC transport system permease protein [Streptomyces sp. Ag82_O1-12]|uniref:ABC transporter permease n=1 Tax=unclassified Streptomyces TaxID=2593676 RepID=UPI000BC8B5B0|nr:MULTISPECIES: FtsX-like permease family protein [unclassified Streptomyces]SMQ18917.1 putative ABC transport system permease protein [Streptomyces sp. Ag82_O1-12]SOD47957.1 putative ABC transport system permease protein [Streptomyces sp. Ag82_G6-1]
MIGLALRSLKFHKGGFVASFIALFFGATIVIACGGLLETGVRGLAEPQRLRAAPIVLTGDQGYPESNKVFRERVRLSTADVSKAAAVPGVQAAVPDLSIPAVLAPAGGKGTVPATGHGWDSARLGSYRLVQGGAPEAAGQVVLDARLAARTGAKAGDRVTLGLDGTLATYRVTGLVSGPGEAGTLFLADGDAARHAPQQDKVDSIGILTRPGADTDEVRAALADAFADAPVSVLTGGERGRAEFPEVVTEGKNLVSLSAVFGAMSVMVTVFVVASTLGLSLQQRQRQMALLRAIGSTPGQVRRMVLAETFTIAVFATALACVPGPRLGQWLLGRFVDAGVVPDVLIHRAGGVPMIVGAGAGLVTALGAAWIAARAAARTRPTEALAEASLQRRRLNWIRLLFAVLCLAGGTVLAAVTANLDGPTASSTASPAAMLWTAGFGLLGPNLSRLMTALLHWPLRAVTGFSGQLALLNAKAGAARLAGAVMPVMLATGLATALIYLQTTQNQGAQQAFEDNLRADLVLTSVTGGMPASLAGDIGKEPGVAAASAYVPSSGFLEPSKAEMAEYDGKGRRPKGDRVQITGVTGTGIERTTAIRTVSGSLADLTGDTVALPESSAGGHRIGERIPMRMGDGTVVEPRLVATVGNQRGYGAALMPAAVVAAHTTDGAVPQILVAADPAIGADRLAAELTGAGAPSPGLRAADRAELVSASAEQNDTQTWVAYLLVAMVVGYSVIALVNSLVMATGERRREFTLQRLVGATRGQVMRMMTVEALLTALAGLALGMLVAVLTLVPLSQAVLARSVPSGPPSILLAVAGAALVLTVGTTLLTARVALRTQPSAAIGSRD